MKVMNKKDYMSSLESRRKYASYGKDVFVDIDYDMDIVDEIVRFYLRYRSFIDIHMKKERRDLYEYIMKKTKCIDDYIPDFITRLKFVIECRKHIPRCAECGCKLDLKCVKPTHDWPNFCCRRHRAINAEFMERRANAYFKKTGYRHQMQNPEVVKKLSDTVFSRTGYRYSFQDPAVKNKTKLTINRLYGCDNVMQRADVVESVIRSVRVNKYEKMMADDKIRPLFTINQFLDFDRENNDCLWWQCLNPDCMRVFNGPIAHGVDDVSGTYARCPFCYPKAKTWTSQAEIDLAAWCKSVIPPGWRVANNEDENWDNDGFQFDILIEDAARDIKLALEYNGLYYHSVEFQREHGIPYDRIVQKIKYMEKRNIPLIFIWEDEWLDETTRYKAQAFIKTMITAIYENRRFIIGNGDDFIKLPHDKFSKTIAIDGYELYGEESAYEVRRKNFVVLNGGYLLYRKI